MPRAIEHITHQLQEIDLDSFRTNGGDRVALLSAAQALCRRIESPAEFMQRIAYQEPSCVAALQIADDLQLLRHINDIPQSLSTLARRTGANQKLLIRILRNLAYHNIIREVDPLNDPFDNSSVNSRQVSKASSRKGSNSQKNPIVAKVTSTLSNIHIVKSDASSDDAIPPATSPVSSNDSSSDGASASSSMDGKATSVTSSCSSVDGEVGFVSTSLSDSLATDEGSASIRALTEIQDPVLLHSPDYLAANYDGRQSSRNGPFQANFSKQGYTLSDWLQCPDKSSLVRDHNSLSAFAGTGQPCWLDIFDPKPLLNTTTTTTAKNAKYKTPHPLLLVELSNTTANTTTAFRTRFQHTQYPGTVELLSPRSTVQNLANDLTLGAHEITLVAHDLLAPLKSHSSAARLYVLNSTLFHRRSDREVQTVLTNVASVMKMGWSRLVIYEEPAVFYDGGTANHRDLVDLGVGCGRGRSEAEWRSLVDGCCGFSNSVIRNGSGKKLVVRAVHSVPRKPGRVIECEVVERR